MTEPDLPVLAAEPSAARLRGKMVLALDHISDYAICLISPDERIVSWNLGAELLMGYRADEVVGCSASMLFTPEDTIAGSSAAALEAAAITAPHIVLVDLAMPEVDGFGFLKRFRAITGATRLVPVVAVTAYARQEDRDRRFAAGFDAHITKPIDLRQLVTLVAGVLVSDDGNGT